MKNVILFLIAGSTILSCNDELEQKTLDAERFTIKVPSTWTFEEVQGYDSFVRQIKINEQEKISIDLGWYSSNLNVDNSTHNITIKTIDHKDAKIVTPKNFQPGTTGVYFDSLDIQRTKFQMSGIDLSAENQRLFLTAIETLRFK
ncbi:MAG TPA: hypothetical protein PLZ32_15230 [Saprospiraceae bacterium]|nr:hypothetical protein [Saprospiraceae bacterium]